MRTLIGLFDEYAQANDAYKDLVKNGFDRNNLTLIVTDMEDQQTRKGGILKDLFGGREQEDLHEMTLPGIGNVLATGPLVQQMNDQNENLVDGLTDYGVPDHDAQMFAEGLRRGGNLLICYAEPPDDQRALDIMRQYNPVNMGQRMDIIQQKENWQGFNENSQPLTREQRDNLKIPIVQEELKVGKRQVETGGQRIHTYVTQENVQQDVNLRSERVNVERHPADRPASPQDIDAFKESTYEMKETSEEPVVSKEAHVVEDIDINKNVEEHTETVQDTVRRTNVDVDNLGRRNRNRADFDTFEPQFRQHYDTYYAKSNKDYSQIRDAYRFGMMEANEDRFSEMSWNKAEPDIRQDWESTNPSLRWSDVRDAVQTGWNAAQSRM